MIARDLGMSETLMRYESDLRSSDDVEYEARACARERNDGRWEAWLEFEPRPTGGATIRTRSETTQPDLGAVRAWAQGISRVYLEGALNRAVPGTPVGEPVETVVRPWSMTQPEELDGVLDPFEVYAHGQSLLRRHLDGLSASHLRHIARAHDMLSEGNADELTKDELVDAIVAETERRAHPEEARSTSSGEGGGDHRVARP